MPFNGGYFEEIKNEFEKLMRAIKCDETQKSIPRGTAMARPQKSLCNYLQPVSKETGKKPSSPSPPARLRRYDISKLDRSFYSNFKISMELKTKDKNTVLQLKMAASRPEKVGLDFKAANLLLRTLRHAGDFIKTPMRKTARGEMVWFVSINAYWPIYKHLKNVGYVVHGVPKQSLDALKTTRKLQNDVLLYERRLPAKLRRRILPFQRAGVRFALKRSGRALIADEMGTGKSLQALCLAYCYREEWPLLIVAPASLRLVWVAEIEKWFPSILPSHVQVLSSSKDVNDFEKSVVITSYRMLNILETQILAQRYKVIIVDESHKIKAQYQGLQFSQTTRSCLKILAASKRAVLLTGTPCISKPLNLYHQVNALRPGLLGRIPKFSENYCGMRTIRRDGRVFKDASGGSRLEELRLVLSDTVMIRRLKKDVQGELPPLRRQILLVDIPDGEEKRELRVKMFLERVEGRETDAPEVVRRANDTSKNENPGFRGCTQEKGASKEPKDGDSGLTEEQKIGILKLHHTLDFISHVLEGTSAKKKVVVFAHHRIIIKGIVQHLESEDLGYMVIQGQVTPEERTENVRSFKRSSSVRVAVVSITAGNVGFDLSCSSHVVFAELPANQADLRQAEARVHRRNQESSVSSYFVIARHTPEERRWCKLERQLDNTSEALDHEKAHLNVDSIVCPIGKGKRRAEMVRKKQKTKLDRNLAIISPKNAKKSRISQLAKKVHAPDLAKNLSKAKKDRNSEESNRERANFHVILRRVKKFKMREVRDLSRNSRILALKSKPKVRSISAPRFEAFETGAQQEKNAGKVAGNANKKKIKADEQSFWSKQIRFQRIQAIRKVNEMYWRRKVEKSKRVFGKLDTINLMISPFTERVFIFKGRKESEYIGKSVNMDTILTAPATLNINNLPTVAAMPMALSPLFSRLNFLYARNFLQQWRESNRMAQNRVLGRVVPWYHRLLVDHCPKARGRIVSARDMFNRVVKFEGNGNKNRVVQPEDFESDIKDEGATVKTVSCISKTLSKKVTQRKFKQRFSVDGTRPLCLKCGKRYRLPKGSPDARSLPTFFCSSRCFKDFSIKTSASEGRRQVFAIEAGECQSCGLDVRKLFLRLRNLSPTQRLAALEGTKSFQCLKLERLQQMARKKHFSEGLLWNADHIRPVQFGGGVCGIDNFQTLCTGCHYLKTRAQSRLARSVIDLT